MSLPKTRGWRYILFFLVAVATLCFLYRVREVLYAFGFGAVMAYCLYRPVKVLEKRGLGRGWAILLIYGLVIASIGALLYWIVPAAISELGGIADLYPHYVEGVQQLAIKMDGIPKPERMQALIDNNLSQIEAAVYNALQGFINTLYHFVSRILTLAFAPILAFYILNDWEKIREGFLGLLSPGARLQCRRLCRQIDGVLVQFIKGYFLVAIAVGLLTGVLAALLGVPFPLLIGLVAGLTNLVPYFGPFLGGIPIVALAGSESLRLAIYMALGILIIQQLDANLFTPKIIGQKLGMHPLLIIFALLAGGSLLGLWGLLLGVPVAAILKVVLHWAHLKIAE